MVEIMPGGDPIEKDPESFIALLTQMDQLEGGVSNETSRYNEILEKWRAKEITDEEAVEKAKAIAMGRQANIH